MLFFPSKCHDTLNGKPFNPEHYVERAMINPKYPIDELLTTCNVRQDSGAFQDIDNGVRLKPEDAIKRQLFQVSRIRFVSGNKEFRPSATCIYDQMAGVDEKIVNGRKVKCRGTEESARIAVRETIKAATAYHNARCVINTPIMFACQGINTEQYIDCAKSMSSMFSPDDIFAFGGFCIIGRQKKLIPLFIETYVKTLNYLREYTSIREVHILGVTVPDLMPFVSDEATKRGMISGVDSSSIEVNSVNGSVFNDGKWAYNKYSKSDKYTNYHPCDLSISNILSFNNYLEGL